MKMEAYIELDRRNGALPERIFRLLENGKGRLEVAVKECDRSRETVGIVHDITRFRLFGVLCDILELTHPEYDSGAKAVPYARIPIVVVDKLSVYESGSYNPMYVKQKLF